MPRFPCHDTEQVHRNMNAIRDNRTNRRPHPSFFVGLISYCMMIIFSTALSVSASGFVDDGFPFLVIEQEGCYGNCPVYRLSIFDTGKFTFEGIRYVKQSGVIHSTATSRQLQQVKAEVKKAKLHSLNPSYAVEADGCRGDVSDLSWTIFNVRMGKAAKTVRRYWGCRPANRSVNRDLLRLNRLERRVEEILGIRKWVGTDADRRGFLRLNP